MCQKIHKISWVITLFSGGGDSHHHPVLASLLNVSLIGVKSYHNFSMFFIFCRNYFNHDPSSFLVRGFERFLGTGGAWRTHNPKVPSSNPSGNKKEIFFNLFNLLFVFFKLFWNVILQMFTQKSQVNLLQKL